MKKKYLKPEMKRVESEGDEALMDVTSMDAYTNPESEEVTEYEDILSNESSVWDDSPSPSWEEE